MKTFIVWILVTVAIAYGAAGAGRAVDRWLQVPSILTQEKP